MSELKNTFCWSFSQAKDFNECRRRHYWNRYGFWGGWDAMAPPDARTAYRLKQIRNKWSLIGEAVDRTIHEVIDRTVVGAAVSLDTCLGKAGDWLRHAWRQHQSEKWRSEPKRCACIRELYYNEIPSGASADRDSWAESVKARTETCLRNFFVHVLPRLGHLKPNDLLPVARPEQGDPEHFHLGTIKVYAIPDCAYRNGATAVIHDWKTGIRRDEHRRQLAIYGVWAQTKHRVTADAISLLAEYLESGESSEIAYDGVIAGKTCDAIVASVNDMRRFIVNGDTERNEALPIEAFPKTDDFKKCRQCNYRELCDRQFTALAAD